MANSKQVTVGIQLEFHGFDRQSLEEEISRVERELQNMAKMELDAEVEISKESLSNFKKVTEQLEEVTNDLNTVVRKLNSQEVTISVEGQAVRNIKRKTEEAFQEGMSQANMDGGDGDPDEARSRGEREKDARNTLDEIERNTDLLRRNLRQFQSSMASMEGDGGSAPGQGALDSRLSDMDLGDQDRRSTLQQFSGTRRRAAKKQMKDMEGLHDLVQEVRQDFQFLADTQKENSDGAEEFKNELKRISNIQLGLENDEKALQRIVDESKSLDKIVSRTEKSQRQVESMIKQSANQVIRSMNKVESSNIDSFLENFSQISRQLSTDLRLVQRRLEKTDNDLDALSKRIAKLQNQSDADEELIGNLRQQKRQLQEFKQALEGQRDELVRWKNETGRAADKLKSMQATMDRNSKFMEQAQKDAQDTRIEMRQLNVMFDRLESMEAAGENIFDNQQLNRAKESFDRIDKAVKDLRQSLNQIEVSKNLEKQQLRQMANATRQVDGQTRKGAGMFAEEGFSSQVVERGGNKAELSAEEARMSKIRETLQAVDKKYEQLENTIRNDYEKAQEMAQSETVETAEEFVRQSEKVLQLRENIRETSDDIDRLRKSYKKVNPSQAETTQQLINQSTRAKEAQQEYRNLVKRIQRYEAELESATEEGDRNVKEMRDSVEQMKKSARQLASAELSTDQLIESGKVRAQANALQEVRDNVMKTAEEVGQLEYRFNQAQEEMRKSGGQSEEAAQRLLNLGKEYQNTRQDLRRYINTLQRAKQNGRELSDAEERMLRTSRELMRQTRENTQELKRNAHAYERVRNSANSATSAFAQYTNNLADSVKKNFQFISAIGIVASALFGLQMAFEEILEESRAMTRAMTVMRSASMDFVEIQSMVREEVRKTSIEFGERVDETAEVVFQLGSAGLTAEQSMAALDHTMQLIVGTEAEAQEATKAVAGAFNVFAEDMEKATTSSQKFKRITDTMIKVFQEHQVEMNEVIQGLEYSSAAASAAGFSFKETAGFLAVLNDNMIKGGKAGRGLQNVMSKLARNTDKLQQVFGIEVDDDSPLSEQFVDILEQFDEKVGEGALSVAELREQFKLAGLRGGRTFSILVQNIDDVKETVEELKEGAGGAGDRVRDIVEQSFIQSFERAKQALLGLVREGLDPAIMFLQFAADAIGELKQGLDIVPALKEILVVFTVIGGSATLLIQTFSALTQLFAGMALMIWNNVIPAFSYFIKTIVSMNWSQFVTSINRITWALQSTAGKSQAATRAMLATRQAIFGVQSALKVATVAIGGLIAAIPIIVTLLGYFTESLSEVQRRMEKTANEINRLEKANKKLEDLNDRLSELNNLGGIASDSVVGDKLRKELKKLGNDSIQIADILTKSNERIGKSIDEVSKKLRTRIERRKELNRLQKQNKRDEFIEDMKTRATSLTSGSTGIFDRTIFHGEVEGEATQDIQTAFEELDRIRERFEASRELQKKGSPYISQETIRSLNQRLGDQQTELRQLAASYKELKAEAKEYGALEEFKEVIKSGLDPENYKRFQNWMEEDLQESVSATSVVAMNANKDLIGTYDTLINTMETAAPRDVVKGMIDGFNKVENEISDIETKFEKIKARDNLKQSDIVDLPSAQPGMSSFGLDRVMEPEEQSLSMDGEVFRGAFLPDNLDSIGQEARETLFNNLFGDSMTGEGAKFGNIGDQLVQQVKQNVEGIDSRGEVFDMVEEDGVEALQKFSEHIDEVNVRVGAMESLFINMIDASEDELSNFESEVDSMWQSVLQKMRNMIIQEEMEEQAKKYSKTLKEQFSQMTTLNEETQKQAELRKKLNKADIQESKIGDKGEIIDSFEKEFVEISTDEDVEKRQEQLKELFKTKQDELKVNAEAVKAVSEQAARHSEMRKEMDKQVDELVNKVHHYQGIDSLVSDQVKMQAKATENLIEQSRLEQKLRGDFYERQEALTSLVEKQQELFELRRKVVNTFKEETALRYELIASAEEALSQEDDRAGMIFKAQASVSRISALKAKEQKISQRIQETDGQNLQMKREKRAVQQEIVDEASSVLDLEEEIENKMEEINQEVLDKRLELMQEIVESLERQSKKAEEQVNRGLEQSFDTEGLKEFRRAGALAQMTGRTLGDVFGNTQRAMDGLVKKLKNGRVSVEQFMTVVGDERFRKWAEQFQGVNEEIDKMNKKMNGLRKQRLKTSRENFESFLSAGDVEQAREELESMRDLTSGLFKESNPDAYVKSREFLIKQEERLGDAAKSKQQRRLERVKEIADMQKIIRKEVERIAKARKKNVANVRKMNKLIKSGEFGSGLAVKVRSQLEQSSFNKKLKRVDKAILKVAKVVENNSDLITKRIHTAADKMLQAAQRISNTEIVAEVEAESGAEEAGSSAATKAAKMAEKGVEKQEGGYIPGFGGGDQVPAKLEKGEFVMPKEAVSKFGVPFFEMLRRGQVPKFAEGGSINEKSDTSLLGQIGRSIGKASGTKAVTTAVQGAIVVLTKIDKKLANISDNLGRQNDKPNDEVEKVDKQAKKNEEQLKKADKQAKKNEEQLKKVDKQAKKNKEQLKKADKQAKKNEEQAKKAEKAAKQVAKSVGKGTAGDVAAQAKQATGEKSTQDGFQELMQANVQGEKMQKPKGMSSFESDVQDVSKKIDKFVKNNPLLKFFTEQFPKAYKEGVKKIVGMLSSTLENAIGGTTDMIDSFSSAWGELDESLEDIAKKFNDQVEGAQTGLRRNQSNYFKYLDSVRQAEKERIRSRLKAEEKYREELKKIEREFGKNVVGAAEEITSKITEGISKLPQFISKGVQSTFKQLGSSLSKAASGGSGGAGPLGGASSGSVGSGQGIPTAGGQGQGGAGKISRSTGAAIGKKAGKVLSAGVKVYFEVFQKTFETMMSALIGAVGKLFKATIKNDEKLIDRMDQFIETLPSRIEDITSRLNENIDRLGTTFARKLPEIGVKFVEGISGVLNSLGDFLSSEDFQNAINRLLDKLPKLLSEKLLPAIQNVLKGVIQTLPKVAKFVQKFFQELGQWLQSADFQNLVEQLGKALSSIFQSLLKALPDILKGLITAAANLLATIIEQLLANIGDIIVGIVDAITTAILAISENLDVILEALVVGIIKAIGNIIVNLPEILWNVFKALFLNLFVLIKALPWEIVGGILKAMGIVITEAIGGVLKLFGLDKLAKWFFDLAQDIRELPADIWSEFKGFFTNLWKDLKEWFNNLVNTLNPMKKGDGSDTFVKNAVDWVGQAGKDVGEFLGFHTGGVIREKSDVTKRDDEVPIMAQTGEGVLSRKGMETLGGVGILRQLNQGKNPYVENANGELRKYGRDKRFRERRQRAAPKQGRIEPPTNQTKQISTKSNVKTKNDVQNDNSVNVTIEQVNVGSADPESAQEAADALVEEIDSKLAKKHQNKKSEFGKEVEEDG